MRFDFANPEKITAVPKWGTCALQLKTEAECMGRATTVPRLFSHVWLDASILRTEVNCFYIKYNKLIGGSFYGILSLGCL